MTFLLAALVSTALTPPRNLVLTSPTTRLTQESTDGETISPRLLRFPAIHGNTIVFSEAGDLWSAKTSGGLATRLTSGYGAKLYPFISPDGSQIAFTASYDGAQNVYVMPIDGGVPVRLTYDSIADVVMGWTPDGKIFYKTPATSPTNFRQAEMWIVPATGGLPEPTPIKEVGYASYFASGDKIAYNRQNSFLFNWRRYRGGSQGFVSFYNLKTNQYSELPHGHEQSYYPMAIGNEVYYASDKGDGVLNLYKTDLSSKATKKLTNFVGEDIKWANTDGKSIVLLQDGFVWIYNIASGELKKFAPKIASDQINARPQIKHLGSDIQSISLSPSGVRLMAEARGQIFSIPVHSGVTRMLTNTAGPREQAPSWSPDGQTVAYLSDVSGETEIYTQPQMGGKPTQITSLQKTITGYSWFPNGEKLLIQTIDNGLLFVDLKTKRVTEVTKAVYGITGVDVSPDSNWIAYTSQKASASTTLHMFNIGTEKDTVVGDADIADGEVAFDKSGKYLYLSSLRTFAPSYGEFEPSLKIQNAMRIYVLTLAKDTPDPFLPKDDEEPIVSSESPKPPIGPGSNGMPMPGKPPVPAPGTPPPAQPLPAGAPSGSPTGMPPGMMRRFGPRPGGPKPTPPPMKVDLDGLYNRILPLPMPPGTFRGLQGGNEGVYFQEGPGVFHFSMTTKHPVPVITGPIGAIDINSSETMMAYAGGGVVGVVPLQGPPATFGEGAVSTADVEATIDPRKEWNEIFWEAWRFERDNYYDVNFRGQNWKAIGDHYASYLKWVNSRDDLNVILGLLISELGTSHSYVEAPGDLGPQPTPVSIGYLGADYAKSSGHITFSKIYTGDSSAESSTAPLSVPGVDVHVGEYLLDIDGTPVTDSINPASLLLDKAGKYVTITVNDKPTETGAKTYRVKTVPTESVLRYTDFLQKSKALVNKLSGGKIGYMHIRDTAAPGSSDFARGFWSQTDKSAMIIDERWNGGGYINPGFITELAKKVISAIQPRNGSDVPTHPAIDGPKVMLINGYAGSGGDFFPWTFKHEHLGPLIGERTWGGLVGIGAAANLVDGGSVSCPAFSIYDVTTGEIIAENHGIDPDMVVDARPDLVAQGEDPQLTAAIEYLKKQLAANPVRKPRVDLPKVSPEGRLALPKDAPFDSKGK